MRIATWNVNSLKARLPAVEKWIARAEPDIFLLQETKLADEQVPELPFRAAGYDLIHHGEGRWNGVAIASRVGAGSIVSNFGDGPVRDSRRAGAEDDFDPFDEARMLAVVCEGIRFVTVYAPNGRVVGTPFYEGKLAWFERLRHWLADSASPSDDLVLAGDFNITPADEDVWDPAAAHGGTHVSKPERAELASLRAWGLVDGFRQVQPETGRFSWWDYRAGMFHKNYGMRIDLLYVTESISDRIVWSEIDREARKGPPTPSDHAPVVLDLDTPGAVFDAGWQSALVRVAQRQRPKRSPPPP
ncbi:MAG: exodeoxyribonuclease III [Acidimicrobiia bacterium]|nr:exodeoxyribonuclease III [Acidimicrobiia bacterium]MDQ3500044.1 exodeoxyribonuclease III [Actinomycetota bacterium]